MQDFMKVTGMVIGAFPSGEYDKRLTVLTKESGKITVFVPGARRQGNRFGAVADLFVFGEFSLYVGKSAYRLQDAKVLNFFEFLRDDLNAAYYGMYFLELADYYTRENNDEALVLLLVYRALQGLKSEKLDNSFVKTVFELKMFVIEGDLIPPKRLGETSADIKAAVDYIIGASIEKLFSFSLKDDGNEKLRLLAGEERKRIVDRKLNSLEILEVMCE
ncbi:MAG: DNA repair protein RecO [Lachnospiraceae bacterium]|nr:DNA repair protein RecO [Lachnospiraceae bacterium]